jgi:hypothetical protein
VIRHLSILTFVDDASAAQIEAIETALASLPGRLPMARYAYGRDLGMNEGNASFGIVADFDRVDDYLRYRDDPEHRRILAEVVGPILRARAVVQYEVS